MARLVKLAFQLPNALSWYTYDKIIGPIRTLIKLPIFPGPSEGMSKCAIYHCEASRLEYMPRYLGGETAHHATRRVGTGLRGQRASGEDASQGGPDMATHQPHGTQPAALPCNLRPVTTDYADPQQRCLVSYSSDPNEPSGLLTQSISEDNQLQLNEKFETIRKYIYVCMLDSGHKKNQVPVNDLPKRR